MVSTRIDLETTRELLFKEMSSLPRNESGDIVLERDHNGVIRTNVPWDVCEHDREGYDWGFGGNGPSELALNILNLFLPLAPGQMGVRCRYRGTVSPAAYSLHHLFKWWALQRVEHAGGVITGASVRAWIQEQIDRGGLQ